jgi:hypothetical protein
MEVEQEYLYAKLSLIKNWFYPYLKSKYFSIHESILNIYMNNRYVPVRCNGEQTTFYKILVHKD